MASLALAFDILARDKASNTLKKVGDESDRLHKRTRLAAAAGVAAGLGIGALVGGIAATIHTGIGELADYQTGLAQANAVIKSTGGSAGVTSKHVEDLASSIQAYSGQTDDSIVTGENLLLTFTNIRNEAGKGNDVFDQTTKTLADMSQALGEDSKTAAVQLGKALNDPVRGVTALQKVGVSFTAGQKKTIKSLVDSGHTMAAQKVILGELNKEFGGSAKAFGETGPGQIQRAKRAFEDFSQGIVQAVAPAVEGLATHVLPALTGGLGALSGGVGDAIAAVRPFVADLAQRLAPILASIGALVRDEFLPALVSAWKHIASAFLPAVRSVGHLLAADLLPAFRAIASFIVGSVVPVIVKLWTAIGTGLAGAFRNIAKTIDAHRAQLAQVGRVILQVAGFILRVLAPVVGTILKIAFEVVGRVIAAAIVILAGLPAVFSAVRTAASAVAGFFTGPFLRAIGSMVSLTITAFRYVADVWFVTVGALINGAAKAFGWVPGIGGKLKGAAKAFNTFHHDADRELSGLAADAATWGQSTGKNLMDGIVVGINGRRTNTLAIATSAGAAAANAIRHGAEVSSPSKITTYVGQMLSDGIVKGLKSREASLNAALNSVTTRLGDLRSSAQQLSSGIADSITGSAALANTPNQSVGGITGYLRGQLTTDQRFLSNLGRLSKTLRLQPGLVSQLAQAGPSAAGNIVENLAHASTSQISTINSLQSQVNQVAGRIGATAAGGIYDRQIAAQLDELRGLRKDVQAVGHDLAAALHHAAATATTTRRTTVKGAPRR